MTQKERHQLAGILEDLRGDFVKAAKGNEPLLNIALDTATAALRALFEQIAPSSSVPSSNADRKAEVAAAEGKLFFGERFSYCEAERTIWDGYGTKYILSEKGMAKFIQYRNQHSKPLEFSGDELNVRVGDRWIGDGSFAIPKKLFLSWVVAQQSIYDPDGKRND